jgi:cytochrome o ubiquinol oxidase operon protein cyoD
MNTPDAPATPKDTDSGQAKGSFITYTLGFVLSVALTLAAYFTFTNRSLPEPMLVAVIVGLAIAQLLVQLIFFLHLGKESRPRWNLQVFMFMLLVLIIVVFGSLWIMNNLDYNMMSPRETDTYIMQDEGITR